jgi:hypothetical protein
MAEKKNARYFLTADKPGLKLPPFRHTMDPGFVKRVTHLDAETVPGAEFYSEAMWILPGSSESITHMDSHTHTWDEFIGFFGFNYEDIRDLGAEIEFTVDNEKHIITRSFGAFIPAGVQHGPLVIRKVRRPIMHFMAGPTKKYE